MIEEIKNLPEEMQQLAADMEDKTFEETYRAFKEVVNEISRPNLTLDEGLRLYEKGCVLYACSREKLEEFKGKLIEVSERVKPLVERREKQIKMIDPKKTSFIPTPKTPSKKSDPSDPNAPGPGFVPIPD